MPNQRALVVVTPDGQRELLHQQRTAFVATVGPHGGIHLVGM
jgi:hypothetical protein